MDTGNKIKNIQALEARRFFLSITTRCNMACSYCFVDQSNKDMGLAEAKRHIKMFLRLGGAEKLLYFYGGEPLLNFSLIKKATIFFRQEAAKKGINPSVMIVTNGTIATDPMLDFIREYDIKVMVSVSGREQVHDMDRKFISGAKSHAAIINNVGKFAKNVRAENFWVSYTVHPDMLDGFKQDLDLLLGLKFTNIHIEPVQFTEGVLWNKVQVADFEKKVKAMFRNFAGRLEKKNFIFNSKVIRDLEILMKISPTDDFGYGVYNNIRAWPESGVAFSHFVINLDKKRPLSESLAENHKHSLDFGKGGPEYYGAGERIWGVYDDLCRAFAKKIIIKSCGQDKAYKLYLKAALKRAI